MEPLPLSLLNDFLFCNRRAALKMVEGLWGENAHTLVGDLAHEHADLPGYEIAKGVTLLRALPVWSERLGLNGKCDIVERHANGSVAVFWHVSKGRHRASRRTRRAFVFSTVGPRLSHPWCYFRAQ